MLFNLEQKVYNMKTALIIGDLHCGSMVGLTHPTWMISKDRNKEMYQIQKELWDEYIEAIDYFGNVDVLVVNGDAIDGKGIKAGGTEQITTDMIEQAEMAVSAIELIKAKQIFFTFGTPYHTCGKSGEDFDGLVAKQFKASIKAEQTLNIDGVKYNIRHKVASSSSPNNRSSIVGKHRLWDTLEAEREDSESANVYIRSHVHYFSFCGEENWSAYTLPALQASATKFGARQCVGLTDLGMCAFFSDDGVFCGHDFRRFVLKSQKKHYDVI